MTYYLPSNSQSTGEPAEARVQHRAVDGDMADLKIFWGPEICRLEYLLHLLDTGRIRDEHALTGA